MKRGEAGATDTTVSEELQTSVDTLDEAELRALVDYARGRLGRLHSPVSSELDAREGEEFVRVTDQQTYTEVVKREPCADGCPDCPHGPYLYHVTEERHPDGTTRLHWAYLGPIDT